MECRWQVEIDPWCRRVLAKHWPDVRRWDDVRTWPQPDTEPVDLICGGFPCQDISNAGKRKGITGERSGLWKEFARILGVVRPKYALIENVSAILGRGLDTVLKPGVIEIDPTQWPALRKAIDRMLKECRA